MKNTTKKGLVAVFVVFMVLLIDQLSKIWVKTHMSLRQEFNVIGDWFRIYFVENNGMAFGIEAGGKLFLTLFRIVAAVFIIIYLTKLVKQNYKTSFIACIALVLAGATGNIIDSIFYGMIFEPSYEGFVASFVPWGEGYASLFHGKVVDMFFFPIWTKTLPNGTENVIFFKFIFNVADAAISVGVALILIFYRKTLSHSLLSEKERNRLKTAEQAKENPREA